MAVEIAGSGQGEAAASAAGAAAARTHTVSEAVVGLLAQSCLSSDNMNI